ncbi:MAG: molybdopterin oxidoreductase family protein [Acidobacteria bacterium]|nr:molybdopterin oxidoreductase family protein [Acidobacteriota bacterium]
MKRVVHAACPHDCPDGCAVLISVEGDKAVKIQGDPAHPVTKGFLCAKVAKYLDRVYSPARVLHPLRRLGPKGPLACRNSPPEEPAPSHRWKPITWDEALEEISSRFRQIVQQFGSEAILPYSYGGTLGVLNGAAMDRRFFYRLGASQLERTICSEAGETALKSVIGEKLGTEPEQFRFARYIIAWGANIHGNNIHLWPFIEEARRAGAKLVVIDPYRTRTAACADWHLPIHPGTDAALALAMMHVIIGQGLYDADYVSQYTLGFDQLAEKVKEFPPECAAQWTGISASDIRKLAQEYATTRLAVIRLNYGLQRSERGGMSTRTVSMLPALTGSWRDIGGGLQLSTSGAFQLNKEALQLPELMYKALGRPARVVNMVELGKALTMLEAPPIQALFVYNSNPAAVCPNHNLVVRGLARHDLFTVVHEQFFTDTTDYADIVLPATTFFEHKDLLAAYGHYYLQISEQAIQPLGECRPNLEVFRALAHRMGFEEACFDESVDQMIDLALASRNPWLDGINREELERVGHVRLKLPGEPFLPFAEGKFWSQSGRAELYSDQLKAQGLDPVADFQPPEESRHHHMGDYPLEMLARKADNFLNSTFANIPTVQRIEQPSPILEINAEDARSRGIAEGDRVRVFNRRGEISLRARVVERVPPGVVSAQLNWAKLSEDGKNINVLTSEKLTDMGNSATFYSVLVEVERFRDNNQVTNKPAQTAS